MRKQPIERSPPVQGRGGGGGRSWRSGEEAETPSVRGSVEVLTPKLGVSLPLQDLPMQKDHSRDAYGSDLALSTRESSQFR